MDTVGGRGTEGGGSDTVEGLRGFSEWEMMRGGVAEEEIEEEEQGEWEGASLEREG